MNWHGTGLRQSEPENTTDVGRFFHGKCSCEKTPDAVQSNWSVSQVKKALEGVPQWYLRRCCAEGLKSKTLS